MATSKMIKPRTRSSMGAFESSAAARRPRARTTRIAVATQSPFLSANNRVSSDQQRIDQIDRAIASLTENLRSANQALELRRIALNTIRQRQLWADAKLTNGWDFSGGQGWSLATETTAGLTRGTEILPQTIRLTLSLNDVLLLRNKDDVPHIFGPTLIMPGQSFRLPFERAAEYQFACTAHASGQMTIVVEPNPDTPWTRLRWRALELVHLRG